MIQLLFGSCLSEINQHIPLQHYGILLPEQEECSPSSLLNISMDNLKQILLTYGLIIIQRETVKFVLNKSGHGGSYNWSIFMTENDLEIIPLTDLAFHNLIITRRIFILSVSVHHETI